MTDPSGTTPDPAAVAAAKQALEDEIRRTGTLTDRVRELRQSYIDAGGALEDLNEQAQGTLTSLEAFGAAASTSAATFMTSISQGADQARQGIDAYYESLTSLAEFQQKKNVFMDLLEGLGTNYQHQVDEFTTSSENFGLQVGGLVDEMFNDFMNTSMPYYFGTFEAYAGYAQEVYGAVGSGYAAMRDMGEDANAQIASSALMAKGLGFTSTEMMDAMDAQFSKSGEFSNDILREITTYSNSIAAVTGDSNKVIARGILEISTNFETFANVSVETAATTVGGLRSIGLEVKDLEAVTTKFMNFDTAAESLANLNTVFGMQIDTMGMMEAASKDPFEAMMMLREGFLSTGQDFENLTVQQKNLLASQAGLDTEAAARLFDPDRVVANMDELTAATEETAERGILSTSEALDSLATSMGHIPELQGKFSETVMNRMAMRDLSALANSALVADANLTEFAATAQTAVPEAVAGMLGDEEGGTGQAVLEMVGGIRDNMLVGINGLNTGIASEVRTMGATMPHSLFEGLDTSEGQAGLRQSGAYISDQVEAGMRPINLEVGGTTGSPGTPPTPAGDLYVPAVGGPAFELGDPGDEVLIGKPGGAVTRAIHAMGSAILEDYSEAVEPAVSPVSDFETQLLNDLQDRADRLGEESLLTQERALLEDRRPGGRLTTASPPRTPAEDRPINLNLSIALGGQEIIDIKRALIEAGPAGSFDLKRERVG